MLAAAVLLAGLAPLHLEPPNAVERDPQNGLHFHGDGIAWLRAPLHLPASDAPRAFTLAAWLETEPRIVPQSRFVLALDDGHRPPLLQLGEKATQVLLETRAPEGGTAFLGRTHAFDVRRRSRHFVAVASGAGGTRIHVDGRSDPRVTTPRPAIGAGAGIDATLLLGADAHAQRRWLGGLRALAWVDRALDDAELRRLAAALRDGAGAARAAVPDLRIALAPQRLADAAGPVFTPARLRPLRRSVLGNQNPPRLPDSLLALLGFAPLGGLLAARFARSMRRPQAFARAALVTAALALAIEIAQAFIPGRDSSRLDLAMYTTAGLLGAAAGLRRPATLPQVQPARVGES